MSSPKRFDDVHYFDLGDVAAAEFWKDESLQRDPEAPWGRLTAALLHLYHNEEAEAVAIAREITQRGSTRLSANAAALRIVAASDLTAGNYEKVIIRNLSHFPELAEGGFPVWQRLRRVVPSGGF